MLCWALTRVLRSRYFWSITLLLLCHPQVHAQVLTSTLPPPTTIEKAEQNGASEAGTELPDDPSRQQLPVAELEPPKKTGTPVRAEALRQSRVGDEMRLEGEVVVYYKNYVVHADKVVYHQDTGTIDADGHLQLEGGQNDTVLTASRGEIHVEEHTARFFDVIGSFGVRRLGKTQIYTTADPFLFRGRVLLQTGENAYRIVDGSMTSCRLPRPDWELVSKSIEVNGEKAKTRNTYFRLWRVPLFYLPYVEKTIDESGRQSGFLLPIFAISGVKGLVLGEQYYWAINRSMDLTVGAEYWSKRGFAPNGDFRYRGAGLDSLTVRWNALLDRGVNEVLAGNTAPTKVDQGGADILVYGRKDFTDHTRLSGNVEYLSSYIYRLAFDENLAQATSSEVQSELALSHTHRGVVPSLSLSRFQSFAGSTSETGAPVLNVPEVRVLHLPSLRLDLVDRPLLPSGSHMPALYWGMGSSMGDLDRAEPHFHARNVGRFDVYPHLEMPLHLGQWEVRPEFAARLTQYSGSQIADIAGTHFGGVPTVQHDPLTRADVEGGLEVRAPALERDYVSTRWNRTIRHVIEPEFFYRYVTGINNARSTLRFDTTDIATNTNMGGFSLMQRLYLKPIRTRACETVPANDAVPETCETHPREWASWQVTQQYFLNADFGGALIPNRRNVFDSTLDQTGVAFLTSPRNIGPLLSRMRFEAVDHLRIEWDLDYDSKGGRLGSNNVIAGYSFGRTTIGATHALLNAVDETGAKASLIQSQRVQPFLYFGKPSDVGFSVALNSSYDFTHAALQYGGAQAVYNWNCCGLNVGYRRFALGSLRDESEWLWGFTLSGIGTAGNIRRSTSVFPTQDGLQRLY